jgi:hypothetical protein
MKEALKLLLPLIGTTLLSGLIIFLCYVPIGLVTVLSFAVIGPGFLAVAAIVLCAIPCAVASIYFALRYGLAQHYIAYGLEKKYGEHKDTHQGCPILLIQHGQDDIAMLFERLDTLRHGRWYGGKGNGEVLEESLRIIKEIEKWAVE